MAKKTFHASRMHVHFLNMPIALSFFPSSRADQTNVTAIVFLLGKKMGEKIKTYVL